MTRYATYFTPASGSMWAELGKHWLGRDAFSGALIPQSVIPDMMPDAFFRLTQTARRYGFHATLKAPFRLKEGWKETDLLDMACDFCRRESPFPVHGLGVEASQNFIAIRPLAVQPGLSEFAFRCVCAFDSARAALNQEEFEKQARKQLSSRQLYLLQRWGYPYVDEQFQFHLTLSDDLPALDEETAARLRTAAKQYFTRALDSGPLFIDKISIFRQEELGAEFKVMQCIPLGP